MRSIAKILKMIFVSIYDMVNHDGIEHAGYLSFLSMLAIFPFIVFFVALVGLFGGEPISELLLRIITESSWVRFLDALKPRIVEITSTPPQSFLTIAIVSVIWTASSIFEGLRTILNRSYRVTNPPSYLLRRLVSIVEFLTAISIVLTSLIVLLIFPYIYQALIDSFDITDSRIIKLLAPDSDEWRLLILVLFAFFMVSIVFYTIPNRKTKFLYTTPGAVLVVAAWTVASSGFSYYITNFPQVNLIYGSIAGVIISLLYFYICSIILIVGAEFNYHFEKTYKLK
jgi:membrane protein